MTRDEAKQVLAMLSSVYTSRLMPEINELTVNVWYQLLADMDFRKATAIVGAWIATNKYPPTIADIREKAVEKLLPSTTPDEAWTKFHAAIKKYGYTNPEGAQAELGDMWQMVGGDWKYYCTMLEDQLPNERARFLKIYQAWQHRAKERLQIPSGLQERLGIEA